MQPRNNLTPSNSATLTQSILALVSLAIPFSSSETICFNLSVSSGVHGEWENFGCACPSQRTRSSVGERDGALEVLENCDSQSERLSSLRCKRWRYLHGYAFPIESFSVLFPMGRSLRWEDICNGLATERMKQDIIQYSSVMGYNVSQTFSVPPAQTISCFQNAQFQQEAQVPLVALQY